MSKVVIGFTGTRRGMTEDQKLGLKHCLQGADIVTSSISFHHGDCIGADAEAHTIANLIGCAIIIHPPLNEGKRAFCESIYMITPRPYLDRNRDIVDASDVLIAAPWGNKEIVRSGTWSTIRYAEKTGVKIIFLAP